MQDRNIGMFASFSLTAVPDAKLWWQTYIDSFILLHNLNQNSAKLITIHVAFKSNFCKINNLLQVLLEVSVFLSLEVYYLFKVVISI
jgi:hypothetical protein